MGRKHIFSLIFLVAALFLTTHVSAQESAEVLAGRVIVEPGPLYVNQPFRISFELMVTAGGEIDDLRISDFPGNSENIVSGQLASTGRERRLHGKQTVEVLRFGTDIRVLKPWEQSYRPLINCVLSQRRTRGFFSHLQSFPKRIQMQEFTLKVLPLPEKDRPERFSGAVGMFKQSATASKKHAHPGDIVTLTYEVRGDGWLGDAIFTGISASPLFKSYPLKEMLRQDHHLIAEQVIIPQSTNATEIIVPDFWFFNPKRGSYESSKVEPLYLALEAATTEKTSELRMIDTTTSSGGEREQHLIELVTLQSQNTIPLIIVLVAILCAGFSFAVLREKHSILGLCLAVVITALGLGTATRFRTHHAQQQMHITEDCGVYFAPAPGSRRLFTLKANTRVTPLESYTSWVRIDADGKRGWIPTTHLRKDEA